MREIKFRAWAGNNFDRPMRYNVPIGSDGKVPAAHRSQDWPVMQYTGLKDKNGKEIYEGDIVAGKGFRGKSRGEIKYLGWSFVIDGLAEDGKQWFETITADTGHLFYEIEVIGNIYENPELL